METDTASTGTATRTDGGPAFPIDPEGNMPLEGHPSPGMSLRDYFAIRFAAPAWHSYPNSVVGGHKRDDTVGKTLCEAAYRLADELLKARNA